MSDFVLVNPMTGTGTIYERSTWTWRGTIAGLGTGDMGLNPGASPTLSIDEAVAYESWIRIVENGSGWGSTVLRDEGYFLEFDSESLGPGYSLHERDGRIQNKRESQATSLAVGVAHPGNTFSFQPRTDDMLMLLQGFFQAVDFNGNELSGFGTGTFTFMPIEGALDWVGSTWGTVKDVTAEAGDAYAITIDKSFGKKFGSRGERYHCGIIDSLNWKQAYGEDLQIEPHCLFWDVDLRKNMTGFAGSFSEHDRFQDWKGTVAFSYGGVGSILEISNWAEGMGVEARERGRLGTKAHYRFPFGKYYFDGSFELELKDDFFEDIFVNGGSAVLTMRWQNSTTDWIEVEHPNIMIREHDRFIPVNEVFNYEMPYRAYPTADGTPSTIVRVHTIFGTSMFSFYQ
jgi:hypothetical protein